MILDATEYTRCLQSSLDGSSESRYMLANHATQLHDGNLLAPRFLYPNDRCHSIQAPILYITVQQRRLISRGIARYSQ